MTALTSIKRDGHAICAITVEVCSDVKDQSPSYSTPEIGDGQNDGNRRLGQVPVVSEATMREVADDYTTRKKVFSNTACLWG